MKKIILCATAALLCLIEASAVPARRIPRTHLQSDGTTITVTLMGDEFNHSYVTDDGLTVDLAANGDFHYRTPQGVSSMMAHDSKARNAQESAWVSAELNDLSLQALAISRAAKAGNRNPRRVQAARVAQTEVPQTGTIHVPVLLVNYSDIKFKDTDPKATFENQLVKSTTSVRQYFTDQSNGQLTCEFDVLGPVTLSHPRSYYGGNDDSGNDQRVGEMVKEGYDKLTATGVSLAKYDNNGDGMVDVAIVLYAGVGEASSKVTESVWPCQWDLISSDYGTAAYYNGIKLNKFAVFNELYDGQIDGIGTFCHEFSHCIGLPDLYDVNYSSPSIYAMGSWSVLDYGCYNNDGNTPCNYTAYERDFMGWDTLAIPVKGETYTLEAMGKSYKVVNTANSDEYYVLENRQQKGWDKYLAGSGLMVTHVDYDYDSWTQNTVNVSRNHKRVSIIPADNKATDTTEGGDLYPNGGLNTELTDESVPSATVFNGVGASPYYMSQPITDISQSNGKVTFTYMKAELQKDVPVIIPADSTQVQATAFTAQWSGVANAESYTLYVGDEASEPKVKLLLTETFPVKKFASESGTDISSQLDSCMDNTGWTGSYLFPSEGSIKFGSSRKTGTLTSPTVDTNDYGKITVMVDAQSYGNDANVQLKVSAGTASQTFKTTGNKATYTAVLDAHGTTNVTIATTTTKQRALVSGIRIYAGDATQASLAPREDGDSLRRTISGITDTAYTVSGLKAGTKYVYKVKVIYTDGDSSAWSPAATVTLKSNSGVSDAVAPSATIAVSGRAVTISGNIVGKIYSITGREVAPATEGHWTLEPGIYVAKAGNTTRKIIVR